MRVSRLGLIQGRHGPSEGSLARQFFHFPSGPSRRLTFLLDYWRKFQSPPLSISSVADREDLA